MKLKLHFQERPTVTSVGSNTQRFCQIDQSPLFLAVSIGIDAFTELAVLEPSLWAALHCNALGVCLLLLLCRDALHHMLLHPVYHVLLFLLTHHILHRDVIVQAILYLPVYSMQPFPVSNLQGHSNVILKQNQEVMKIAYTKDYFHSEDSASQNSYHLTVFYAKFICLI